MLFPTTDFAIFFAVVLTGAWFLAPRPRWWKIFILAASYLFYAWWDWRFIFLLAACTLISQVGARLVQRATTARGARRAMIAAVAGDIALLGWFKYYGFLALNAGHLAHALGLGSRPLPLLAITLPVGISFFIFMGVSYVVDVYRGKLAPSGWLDVAVYLSFFPHLVAGPIVRGPELLPQLKVKRNPRNLDLSRAAYLIVGGLFKKVVISSFLASSIVDPVFGSPAQHSSAEILFAIYAYAVQIYADFSGYTDMAIGIAMLLGIRFPQNFDAPYTARNLQDFWRRWHMTLSFWLRDYLYFPLGGSREGRWKTYRNIMITMLIGGLWHGAAWTFVAWGAIHGAGQVIGHARRSYRVARGLPAVAGGPLREGLQRFVTFHVVCFGWVFFRADSFSTAATLLGRLFSAGGPAPLVTPLVALALLVGLGTQFVPGDMVERAQARFSRFRPTLQGAMLGGALLAVTTLGPAGVAPFIYYRF